MKRQWSNKLMSYAIDGQKFQEVIKERFST